MADYKDENGTTRVGDFLRGLKDVAKPVLTAAGGLTGQGWLSNIADGIRTSTELDSEQKKIALSLLEVDMKDRASARERDTRIQESNNSSWLAKNVMYLLAVTMVALLVGIVWALFNVEIPKANENTLYMVLGVVVGTVTTIISYFFGSSGGSKEKTQELLNKIKK